MEESSENALLCGFTKQRTLTEDVSDIVEMTAGKHERWD